MTATILVAEDNAANRELIRELLEANGFAVLEAADGEAAIAQIPLKPDLFLLDIRMPKASGFQVLQAVRKDPEQSGKPVFAVTAFAMEGDRGHALAAGFDDYISKPIARNELIEKIHAALQASARTGR